MVITFLATMTPACIYLFQIGGGEAKNYLDIRDEFVDATPDKPFIVDSIADLPANLPETRPTGTISPIVTDGDCGGAGGAI